MLASFVTRSRAPLNAVAKVSRDENGRVILRLKDREDVLQVSQPYAHLFRQM